MSDITRTGAYTQAQCSTRTNIIPFSVYQYKRRIREQPLVAEHYFNLSLALTDKDHVWIDIHQKRTRYTKKCLLTHSVRLNPDNPFALNNLANMLDASEVLHLSRAGFALSYTKIELLQKAIRIDPSYANAYSNLAVAMEQKGVKNVRLRIRNKMTVVTPKRLYEMALVEDPKHALAFNNIALTLSEPNETISLRIGGKKQTFTEQALYLRSIECDAKNADVFYNLSTLMDRDQAPISVVIEGETHLMTKKDLLVKAIALNPAYSNAYYNLANLMCDEASGEVIVPFQEGTRSFTPRMLYIKAIESDANNAMAYHNLALLLSPDEKIHINILGQSCLYTKQRLNIETVERAPTYAGGYLNLAGMLKGSKDTVKLKMNNQIQHLTKQELLEIARSL